MSNPFLSFLLIWWQAKKAQRGTASSVRAGTVGLILRHAWHFQKYMLNKWMNKRPPPLRWCSRGQRKPSPHLLGGRSRIRWEPLTASGPEGTSCSPAGGRTETRNRFSRLAVPLAVQSGLLLWGVLRAVHNESRCVNYCILLTNSRLPVHTPMSALQFAHRSAVNMWQSKWDRAFWDFESEEIRWLVCFWQLLADDWAAAWRNVLSPVWEEVGSLSVLEE